MALLKLSDQYTPERLEAACAKALFYTPRPSYKSIQTSSNPDRTSLPKSLRIRLQRQSSALHAALTTTEGGADNA